MKEAFYITEPIFYPNADLHMGHAYVTVLSDILARSHRLFGQEVFYLLGNDENASKVARVALALGHTPKEFVDEQTRKFKVFYERLGIEYDAFVQTSDKNNHWPGAILMWQKLMEAGGLEKRSYTGLYCVGCESFKTEKDLVDGKCPDHDKEPEKIEEENYFFKLSAYTERIKALIEKNELLIVPETRRNEILALLERGLEDVSFSRPTEKVMGWGVPVPGDPSQVMYVWCDALVSYLSTIGFGRDEALFKKFWPADVHIIGKDILRFHAGIWPGMLLAAGLPLPKTIFVHGMITSGGRKMSKSIGNVIDPIKLVEEYNSEALRYFLAREISPFNDGDVTEESFKAAYNANLANGLGNVVSRILKMAETNLSEPVEIPADTIPEEFKTLLNNFEVQKAADLIWQKISALDERIQLTQPFKLVKEQPEAGKVIIRELVVDLYSIAQMLAPFLPDTSVKIETLIKNNQSPAEPLFARKY